MATDISEEIRAWLDSNGYKVASTHAKSVLRAIEALGMVVVPLNNQGH